MFRSILLPFYVQFYYHSQFRFFCRLRLNGTVSPPGVFSRVIRTYLLATSIVLTATRLMLAVGSLMSLLARSCCEAYSDHTKQVVIYVPLPPGPQTRRYIAKIAAGGNQGNRTRNRQVLSEIYRVGVGRKEALEWKTVETERTVQQNGPDHFTPFLGKRCRRATQTERTIFRTLFRRVPYIRTTTARASNWAIFRENCSRRESRQLDEV